MLLYLDHRKAVGDEKGVGERSEELLILAPIRKGRHRDVREGSIGKAANAQLLAPVSPLLIGPQFLVLTSMTRGQVIDDCRADHPVVGEAQGLLSRPQHSISSIGYRMWKRSYRARVGVLSIIPGSAQAMIGVELMIKFHRVFTIIVPAVVDGQEVIDNSRTFGIRDEAEHFFCHAADPALRNDVAKKGIARESALTVGPGRGRIVDLDQTSIRVLQLRKIPCLEGSRRHRGNLVGGPRAELEIVQVKEEKRPVLENGSANAAPILILAVDRSRPLITITGIEDDIAEKLVQAPVKIIGSRLDGKPFYASAGISEF